MYSWNSDCSCLKGRSPTAKSSAACPETKQFLVDRKVAVEDLN